MKVKTKLIDSNEDNYELFFKYCNHHFQAYTQNAVIMCCQL